MRVVVGIPVASLDSGNVVIYCVQEWSGIDYKFMLFCISVEMNCWAHATELVVKQREVFIILLN